MEASGATPDSSKAAAQNTELLNGMLASLQAEVPGICKAPDTTNLCGCADKSLEVMLPVLQDTLFIPNKTFWLAGGVQLRNAHNVTLQLDGTLEFLPGMQP